MGRYLRVNLLGPGHRLIKKIICRAAVSQRLRNTDLDYVARRQLIPNLQIKISPTYFYLNCSLRQLNYRLQATHYDVDT